MRQKNLVDDPRCLRAEQKNARTSRNTNGASSPPFFFILMLFAILPSGTILGQESSKNDVSIKPSATSPAPWYDSDRRRAHFPHLTPDWVREPWKNFDAERWADQLHQAGMKSVVFAVKQSYGEAYYPSKVACSYVGRDLLGPLTKALHARDMRILAYINLNDRCILQKHPDWRMQGAGTDPVQFNEEYQNYILDIVEEIAREYPVDGIWFDLWGTGTDLMKKVLARVKPYRSDLAISFNGSGIGGDELTGLVSYLSTEGHDFRTCSRHAKALRRWGKPFELQIPENLGGWLTWRPRPGCSLMVLAALTAANGGTPCFGVSLSPDGWLDQGMLDELGKTWHWLEKREPWFVGMQSWVEVGAVMSTESLSQWYHPPIGLHAALVDNHIPYDIVRPEADFSSYRVLVLTDKMKLDAKQAERIRKFVNTGGKLLALYGSYLNIEDVLGIKHEGTIPDDVHACYIVPGEGRLWQDINSTPVCIRGSGCQASYLVRLDGGTALAYLTLPFSALQKPEIYQSYNPPSREPTKYPAIVHHKYGAGETIYVSAALTTEIETIQEKMDHSAAYHKRLIANLLSLLGGADLLRTDAPAQVEITLGKKDSRYLVHITDCSAAMGDRFGPVISDIPQLHMMISLPLDRLGSATRLRLVPEGQEVETRREQGRLEFKADVKLHSIYEIY
jgi:hypothetical protein